MLYIFRGKGCGSYFFHYSHFFQKSDIQDDIIKELRGGHVKGRSGPRALSPNNSTFVLALKINLINI
jgi:hypothetical protein